MLRSKAMCLLLPTLLFTVPSDSNTSPQFETKQLSEIEGVEIDKYYIENPKMKEFKKNTEELIRKHEIEEQKRKEEELRKQLEAEAEQKKKEEGIPIKLFCTYYGSSTSQCGNSDGIMANQEKAHYGAIACPNSIPFGSKIIMDESGREFICKDRGNPNNICELGPNYYRVDIFIPRLDSEINNDAAYEERVRKMGTDKVTARLFINEE